MWRAARVATMRVGDLPQNRARRWQLLGVVDVEESSYRPNRARIAAQAQEYPAPVLMTSAGREREQVALVTDTCRVSLDKSELTPDRPPISGRALCVSTCPFRTLASHARLYGT